MRCLRCNGSRVERKKPNQPRVRCYWCEGTGIEPEDWTEAEMKAREASALAGHRVTAEEFFRKLRMLS